MLSAAKVMGFIPTRDFKRARAFYEGILGLVVTSVDDFAIASIRAASWCASPRWKYYGRSPSPFSAGKFLTSRRRWRT